MMTPNAELDRLLTIADVARILVCSEANVYALIEAGQLPYVAVGKSKGYRVAPKDLTHFIERRRIQHDNPKEKVPRPRLKHIKL